MWYSWYNSSKIRPVISCEASPDDLSNEGPAISLSPEEAAIVLGIHLDASFDDIVAAKNARLEQDGVERAKVEAAYDALLMRSMKKRLSGSVDTSVRFADVPKYKTPEQKKNPLDNLPGGLQIQQPPQDKAVVQAAAFGTFALWALIQGATDSPSAAQADVAGLQLGLSFAASIYFLREYKRAGIGRAAAITGASLVAGALLGGLLQSWLRVDIVPIGSFDSPGVLVSEFAIVAIWAACTFLA
eukprot:CAMPEP_0177578332 /NCGR_PEP_ID=MMETSP0419_2-20121207/287_1 /TAXON_ID=582737 /ORGANISM="Tetraselmis sp., Strain GSL018" /LENGTH=242 /DNA_ID=CAMNT_0019066759 /DNA_START=218 /DNA_END=946 /DNA_ORIENTATION=-